MRTKVRTGLLAGVSLATLFSAGMAAAQSSTIDEVVVTGSRALPRTVMESPVPVDSFSAADIEAISHSDTQDLLKTLVPSYTITRQPISDGATFIRPAALRGLSSDKTLLLVNSKRRHRAALVTTGGDGSQSADAAQIPSAALKSVEVLRDGAGAQYGSDAIAGVINFILKDNAEGGLLSIQAGQYYEKDGEGIVIGGNKGFSIGDSGFVSVSFEWTTDQPTSRGKQYCNRNIPNQAAGFCSELFATETTAPGSPFSAAYAQSVGYGPGRIPDVWQKWGQPESEALRVFVNAGYEFSDNLEFYIFGNYGQSHAKEDFNYRPPIDIGATTNQADDYVYTRTGGLFRANQIFPRGFTPQFFGDVYDTSVAGGFRGEVLNGLGYDLSARYGRNELAYDLTETVNFSLGEASPTEFHVGSLVSDEWSLNADFTYAVPTGFTENPLAIAFGAEYRKEGYEILTGDVPSYTAGPYSTQDPYDFCTNEAAIAQRTLRPTAPQNAGIVCNTSTIVLNGRTITNPVYAVLGVGSNGAPGFPPLYSGRLTRDSYAAYAEASLDVTDRLFLQGSLRGEDFSDFGSTVDYKVAGRFEIVDGIAVRGSIGTGFRAPTTGQTFTTYTSTVVNNGVPVAQGLFPATNPVAQYLGAAPLGPEKSKNYSIGLTMELVDGLNITLDAYHIKVDDMFYAITPITVTPTITAAMIAAGIPGADTIGQVNFFQNAFDASVTGLDVVATYARAWENGQSTNFSASFNINNPVVEEVKKFVDATGTTRTFFDGEYIYDFKHATPHWRSVLTATHHIGAFSIMGRANVYGSYKNMYSVSIPTVQTWDPEVQFDVEANWDVDETYTLTLGVRNIFDSYPTPDETGEQGTNGRIYRSDSIVDWQGGFYYAKIQMKF